MKTKLVVLGLVSAALVAVFVWTPLGGMVSDNLMNEPGAFCLREGAACSGADFIVCTDHRLQRFSCPGPRGCYTRRAARRLGEYVHCDIEGMKAGDPCPRGDEGDWSTCSADGEARYTCEGGQVIAEACLGPEGCSFSGERVECDASRASVDAPCAVEGMTSCSFDGSHRLECHKGTFVIELRCDTPPGCQVEFGDDGYFDTICGGIGVEGEPCRIPETSTVCSVAGDAMLQCRDGVFVVDVACRGEKGCFMEEETGDLLCYRERAALGDPCDENRDGWACSLGGEQLLECVDGSFAKREDCDCTTTPENMPRCLDWD